jgi:thiol:disulfide interchange protein DsbD
MVQKYLKIALVFVFGLIALNLCAIQSLEELFSAQHSAWVYILVSFVAGITVSLTPCLYPMIPITAGVLQSQKAKSNKHTFFLACCYVLGIATVYSLLGYIATVSGEIFGSWMSSPWVICPIFIFFIYLAGAMFGWYQLSLPQFMTQKRFSVKRGGSFVYTFVVGMIAGTVASPCASPALIGILGFVSTSDRPIVGFASLFAFAIGMSLLLLIVGAFSSAIARLPRAGLWMLEVNRILGFMILFIGTSFILPFIPDFFEPVLYGGIMLAASAYYWVSGVRNGRIGKMVKFFFAILLAIVGIAFFLDPLLVRYNVSFAQYLFHIATRIKGGA